MMVMVVGSSHVWSLSGEVWGAVEPEGSQGSQTSVTRHYLLSEHWYRDHPEDHSGGQPDLCRLKTGVVVARAGLLSSLD